MRQFDTQPLQEQILNLVSPRTDDDVDQSLFHAELTGCAVASMTRDGHLCVEIRGQSHSSRLGNGIVSLRHRADLPSWNAAEGEFTMTSYDGDTICGTYRASGVPRPNFGVRFTGFWSFAHGTGAFAGVSGGGVATGTVYSDGTCFIVLDGVVKATEPTGMSTENYRH